MRLRLAERAGAESSRSASAAASAAAPAATRSSSWFASGRCLMYACARPESRLYGRLLLSSIPWTAWLIHRRFLTGSMQDGGPASGMRAPQRCDVLRGCAFICHAASCTAAPRGSHLHAHGCDAGLCRLPPVVHIVGQQHDGHGGDALRIPCCRHTDGAVIAVIWRLAGLRIDVCLPEQLQMMHCSRS